MALERAGSRRTVEQFTAVAKKNIAKGSIVAFERPAHCRGWGEKEIQELRQLLPHECSFDGCAYGLRGDRTGKFAKKP